MHAAKRKRITVLFQRNIQFRAGLSKLIRHNWHVTQSIRKRGGV